MKNNYLILSKIVLIVLLMSVSLKAQVILLSQNFETSQTTVPTAWKMQVVDSTVANPGWGFNNKFPNDTVGLRVPNHTYFAFVDANTNPNNKVAYYSFDATPVGQPKPPVTAFSDKANVVIMFEGTAWEVADSTHYGNDSSYILTVNPFYHHYKQIRDDIKTLQAKGVKVLWNLDDAASWNTATPFTTYNGTALTAAQFAAFVKANVIDSLGLDGIALDVEHLGSTSANASYIALLKALGAYFGPKSSNPAYTVYTAAIYNGAAAGNSIGHSSTVAAYFNHIMDMGYWQNNTTRFNNWGNVIGHGKVMDGFSHQLNILTNALSYATWQPLGASKAGVMVYAANVDKGYTDSIFDAETPSNPNTLTSNYDTLYSPVFSCAGQAQVFVSFDLIYKARNGNETANLIVSNNGGNTWTTVTSTGLPNNGYIWQDSLVYEISAFAADSANVKLAITYFDGCPNVSAIQGAVFAIDNIKVVAPVGVGTTKKSIDTNFSIYPNPSKGNANIVFDITKEQNVAINVYNILGQKMHSFNLGKTNAGHHTLSLNAGNLQAGVYIVNLTTDNSISNQTMVIE